MMALELVGAAVCLAACVAMLVGLAMRGKEALVSRRVPHPQIPLGAEQPPAPVSRHLHCQFCGDRGNDGDFVAVWRIGDGPKFAAHKRCIPRAHVDAGCMRVD